MLTKPRLISPLRTVRYFLPAMPSRWIIGLLLPLALAGGCHRNIEPFDPDEQVAEPDLSAIFPEGAERSNASPERPSRVMPMADRRAGQVTGPPLSGQILLAPELAARVPRGAVLFLIARTGGSGPPVAAKRISAPEFPLAFELGPQDRMAHDMPYEGPFQLIARIDADGDAATHSAGDLRGVAEGSHSPGATDVTILIDEIL
jgi:cytochrome c-type biogenesis protein CcmH